MMMSNVWEGSLACVFGFVDGVWALVQHNWWYYDEGASLGHQSLGLWMMDDCHNLNWFCWSKCKVSSHGSFC